MQVKSLTALLLMLFMSACGTGEKTMIRNSVTRHLETYPASRLQDLYKSYFQDYFGPGHLINNAAGARKYLEYELAQDDYKDTVMIFPTGYRENFLRVNLQLIKDGTIPLSMFLEEFIESANAVKGIPMDEWKEEWSKILSVIEEVAPDLPGFEEDRESIDALLAGGEYVMHHSQAFTDAYHPHYRIIHKEVFEEYFEEYLPGSIE